MKQKDIFTIVMIVIISATISLFLSNILISSPKNRQQKVEVAEAISDSFQEPDSKYFNKESLNHTQKIQIGDSVNDKPLSDKD